jgi:polyphosphate kinase
VSDNIQVRSIIGRFLEHSRISYFENAAEPEVYCASADWMDRNFFVRVETWFPIQDATLAKQVVKEGLTPYLNDNTQAWLMAADGSYERVKPGSAKPRSAQLTLLEGLDKRKPVKPLMEPRRKRKRTTK